MVAEGIETPTAARAATDLGCDFLQGYELARPAPPEAMPACCVEASAAAIPAPIPRSRVGVWRIQFGQRFKEGAEHRSSLSSCK